MSFLKKLGQILAKATQIAIGIGPLTQTLYPQGAAVVKEIQSDLAVLAQLVVNAEAMGQALNIPGPDKARAIAPLIAQSILQSQIMLHRKIKDPTLFLKGCTGLGGDLADILNSLDDDIQTQDKA